VFDPDHGLAVEGPSPTELDADQEHEVVPQPPFDPVHAYEDMPDRRSTGADSLLEELQAVSDALRGNAKESRRISGTARDVLNAARSELQRERSLDPEE
jgi:hypothetical protein